MAKENEEQVLNAILIACIAGIIIIVGLILFYPRPSEAFSAIYFVNYTKTPIDGYVYFNYTIENHEGRDVAYAVSYLIDNVTVDNEQLVIVNGGNSTVNKQLIVDPTKVQKIQVIANNSKDAYEIHFWTKVA